MNANLPTPVLKIIRTLTSANFTCEIVGGAVRDLVLGIPTNDWDFTTNATPQQIMPLFPDSFYENTYGTVMIAQKHLNPDPSLLDPDLIYDITTYRSDGTYRNHRQPETVTWGKTIEEDLQRRDFTINAMALRGSEIIDPYEGQKDLRNKVIRTVGNPQDRFEEDALRMLRAVRFSVQLGFEIEGETKKAISAKASLLSEISWERIGTETMKILGSPEPKRGILLLDELGLLPFILPELVEAKNVRQSGHHIYDVWDHSLNALAACESSDPVVRLATLLHDIGKPVTAKETSSGTVTFYSHEVLGARTAKAIAKRLQLGSSDCNRIFTLVRWHMFTYDKDVTDAYIRRFIRRVGVEHINDMITLRIADRVGSGSKRSSWRLEELQQRVYEQLHQPLSLKDMAIDGHDVMEAMHIKPGPEIGKILSNLFEDVLENPEHNTREYLLSQITASE
ncbi:MAG TPA: HD domain-containing protein [Patescibacteria group bacterium]|nr:HD domain-containing protein [Patescibacteria group bacterium]